ncbi:MAG: CoA ester lyase [Conexibacteraceae bacterium]|nr:CoA ester lyase [Conexibacteraceae bacterium]
MEIGRLAVVSARLRSALYMPGANERALEKARELPADALILDLEDAVAPDAKAQARERVCEAARSGAYGQRTVTIRVNAIGTEWHDADLAAAGAAGPDAILVPKVGSAGDVLDVEAALVRAGAPDRTRIWTMLETPAAVLQAAEIAGASARLSVLVVGTNDLLKELFAEATPGRESLQTSLALCLLGARTAGKAILDGVYNDVRDTEGFEAECLQGRRLGFDGKTLIHPGQIEICNRVFSPSEQEVAQAHRVIEAFEAADGAGVVTLDGRMIENLHVESAKRVLSLAQPST